MFFRHCLVDIVSFGITPVCHSTIRCLPERGVTSSVTWGRRPEYPPFDLHATASPLSPLVMHSYVETFCYDVINMYLYL